jgi:hypothetical protein
MLHQQLDIHVFTKHMKGSNVCFWGEGVKQDICTFVAECDTCQFSKGETVKITITLQPLPIPPIWMDISMDFIVGLPKSGNKSVIMVVVDHISKYVHLCALQHLFKTSTLAQIFMDNIFKLHGMPHSIVSDHDPTFTGNFWYVMYIRSEYKITQKISNNKIEMLHSLLIPKPLR